MKKICAVFDKDEQYAYRFMNYVNDKRLMPYEVIIFTQKILLEEYGKETRIELLLVADNKDADMPDINAGRVIRLCEEPSEEQDAVYKYQSTDALIKEILCKIGDVTSSSKLTAGAVKAHVYGVYSPVGRNYKTTFALAAAMCIGRNHKTLYLNLEEFCGMEELVDSTAGNMSELLYYFRNNKEKLKARISQTIRSTAGFDYIPVCATPEDYEEVKPGEWMEFILFLIENGAYEAVVIDIGNVVHEAWRILELCQTAYMPASKDAVGKNKEKCFREYMRLMGKNDLLQKLQMIDIPYDTDTADFNEIGKIQWSKSGEFARRLIYGQ